MPAAIAARQASATRSSSASSSSGSGCRRHRRRRDAMPRGVGPSASSSLPPPLAHTPCRGPASSRAGGAEAAAAGACEDCAPLSSTQCRRPPPPPPRQGARGGARCVAAVASDRRAPSDGDHRPTEAAGDRRNLPPVWLPARSVASSCEGLDDARASCHVEVHVARLVPQPGGRRSQAARGALATAVHAITLRSYGLVERSAPGSASDAEAPLAGGDGRVSSRLALLLKC
eukprot:scaffold2775_cov343-Prasinococcus_capsulatus_cf.AAC.2